MSEHHWYKLRKRLENMIHPSLNLSFIYIPLSKKTQWSEITVRFFQIKLDNEIIWAFPKNTNQNINQGFIHGCSNKTNECIEFPIQSIIKYLDLPRQELIKYQDNAGLADILKAMDRRISPKRLKELELSPAAKQVLNKWLSLK